MRLSPQRSRDGGTGLNGSSAANGPDVRSPQTGGAGLGGRPLHMWILVLIISNICLTSKGSRTLKVLLAFR